MGLATPVLFGLKEALEAMKREDWSNPVRIVGGCVDTNGVRMTRYGIQYVLPSVFSPPVIHMQPDFFTNGDVFDRYSKLLEDMGVGLIYDKKGPPNWQIHVKLLQGVAD